jgi:hypothetical protein
MISDATVQISPFALSLPKTIRQIFNPHSAIRIPQLSTRWHAHLHGLATSIHETSALAVFFIFVGFDELTQVGAISWSDIGELNTHPKTRIALFRLQGG